MTSINEGTHLFIVRVWREPREIEGETPQWRGVIEHIASGRRQYFNQLDQIEAFIIPYLQELGVAMPARSRLRHWLRRQTRR